MEDSVKQNLQERLLDAVKQCQTHFGARQEMATEEDLRVNALCLEWEAVLSHGYKKPKTNKLLAFGNKMDNLTGVPLWPVIRPFLSNEEQDKFIRLRLVNSDIGRGRAWLRDAINERTLERYLQSLLSDRNHLKGLYEPGAFLLDQERATMLPVMAAGLSSIIFSLTVDAEYLNSPLKTFEVPSMKPALRPVSSTAAAAIKPSFALRIGSLQDESLMNSDEVVAVSNRKSKNKKKKKTPSPDIEDSFNATTPTNKIDINTPTNQMDTPTNANPFSTSPHTLDLVLPNSVCNVSPASMDGVYHHGNGATLLDTNFPPELNLSPDMSSHSSSPVGSVQSINSEDNGVVNALFDSQSALEATNVALEATLSLPSPLPAATSAPMAAVMTESEMKEALKALVHSKENIEESQKMTLQQLNIERERVKELERELAALQHKLNTTDEAHSQQRQSLERENDLLREQLKRYVGMVQQQQQKPDSEQEDESTVDTKLSEMAEMYGELMEFNEHLHKAVQTKDTLIIKLVHTLQLASIPLPVSPDLLPREALEPTKIVEVWIPSVIKRGRGPDSHHEYQIYIKLGTEEWNVYRRFAEMYEFHRQLVKNLQGVDEFPFPPKRAIGNKGSQVIEERRKKLQQYLRLVLELCCRPTIKRKDGRVNSAFVSAGMSKEEFLKVLPFFNDRKATTAHAPVVRSPSYSGL